jgi:molybdopterin converting factor small subunit
VRVLLPASLTRLFPGSAAEHEIEAATVAELIAALDARWPGMRDRLCDATPALRRHINIFVEGHRATLDTVLPPGGEVVILTAISGG